MLNYQPKTEPFAHQRKALELQGAEPFFALPMDMGTGKTKVVIDTAAMLYEQGQLNALVVVAPNGVSRQWVEEQVPAHLPDRIPRRAAVWYSQPKVAQKKAWDATRKADDSVLTILAFHYEACSTERGKKELWWVLEHSRAMLVLDESHRIKSPSATSTKAILAAGHRAKYRRILSGTPFTNSPLDAYSQFQFLSQSILRQPTYAAFKARYAEVEEHCGRCHHVVMETDKHCPNCFQPLRETPQYSGGRRIGKNPVYANVVSYRNQDELRGLIAPYCFRVKKENCLDLPPKIYETRPVQMSPTQKRLYQELLEEGVAFLPVNSAKTAEQDIWDLFLDKTVDKVVAKTALSNIVRRRQVLGGFLAEDGILRWLDDDNPRIRALLDVLKDIDGKVLIWAAFTPEVEHIVEALPPGSAVGYHGPLNQESRAQNKERFINDPECRYFVGTAATGGTGVDGLVVANTVVYYSNSLRAGDRWQSEDRAHRIGQKRSVTYIDLVCEGSLDERILETFVTKRAQAEYLLGDHGL